MQIVFGIVVVVLLTAGVRAVVNRLSAAGQQRYAAARTKLTDWRAAQATRPAPPPSPLAIKLGTVAGGVTQGAVLAWSAGVPGWRLGWGQGRQQVRDWWERRQAEPQPEPVRPSEPQPHRDADGRLAFGDDPADPNATRECPDCHGALLVQDGQQICPACLARQQARNDDYDQEPNGRPNLWLVRPEPSGGAVPVIEATGEITTVADLRAEAQAGVTNATAELDDAQAEVARRTAILNRRQYAADVAPSIIDRDPRGQGAVASMVEPAQRALDAARSRAAACEADLAQSQATLAALNQHRAMEEARASTPQASTRTQTYQPQ